VSDLAEFFGHVADRREGPRRQGLLQQLQQDDEAQNIAQKKRVLKIAPQNVEAPGAYTRYFLIDLSGPNNIEVIVLKLYLKEKLQLEFKLRDLNRPA
jgi:hypothetical protein